MAAIDRHNPMKQVNVCAEGGFVALQMKLLNQDTVKCPACVQMLEKQRFDKDAFSTAVENYVEKGLKGVSAQAEQALGEPLETEGKEKKGNEAEGKEKKGNEPEGKETEENGDMDEQHDGPEACRVWMKQHEPTIELLPPGTYNEKYPYRCRLCRTRGWPDGRVGELGRLKLYSVKHFVERRLKSDMHLKYARMSEAISSEDPPTMVPCEGLLVGQEDSEGKLHLYSAEFSLWASFANLTERAKHGYWHDANIDRWFVRSVTCEKETQQKVGQDRHTCKACLHLSGSKSASWPKLWFRMVLDFNHFCS